jgi:hypothetical protein
MRETQPASHAEAMPAPPELTAGTMRPAYAQPASGAWEAKQKQAEEQRQAQIDTSRMRKFKAKAAPFAVHGANAAPPAGATETATAAPQLETQPAATAEPAPMLGIKSSWDVTTPAKPMQLPSGRGAPSPCGGKLGTMAPRRLLRLLKTGRRAVPPLMPASRLH